MRESWRKRDGPLACPQGRRVNDLPGALVTAAPQVLRDVAAGLEVTITTPRRRHGFVYGRELGQCIAAQGGQMRHGSAACAFPVHAVALVTHGAGFSRFLTEGLFKLI